MRPKTRCSVEAIPRPRDRGSDLGRVRGAGRNFHRNLAEATDNVLLLSLFDHLNAVRRAVAWNMVVRSSDRPPRTHSSFAEHDAIVAAIEARDPKSAQEAMRAHLGSVSARLFGEG